MGERIVPLEQTFDSNYYVVVDQTLSDGCKVVGIPISDKFRTLEAARIARDRIRRDIPEARILKYVDES